MTLQSVQLADTKSWVNGDIGSKINHNVNINKGLGVAQVYLDVLITPVGVGAITMDKRGPFGIISNLVVRDQRNKQLYSMNAHELIFMSLIMTKRPPFETVMYEDGTNGWVPLAATPSVITAEGIRGTLALPIRLPQGHDVTKLTFEFQLAAVSVAGKGWTGVLEFATSHTSITGSFTPHVEYDDSINHKFVIIKVSETIGTDFTKLGDLPENQLMRYAVIYLDDYWEAENITTDDSWLVDEIEYQSNLQISPVKLNRFSARHIMHDLLDIDPDFVLGDVAALCYNLHIIPFPDTVIGANSEFKVKCDTSEDASMLVVLIEPFASLDEVKAFSPAGVARLLKG